MSDAGFKNTITLLGDVSVNKSRTQVFVQTRI